MRLDVSKRENKPFAMPEATKQDQVLENTDRTQTILLISLTLRQLKREIIEYERH